jgi:hypothetical protein
MTCPTSCRLLSDLVHSSQVNATVHFPWSTPGADLGGNDRNAGAITKANRFILKEQLLC